MEVADVRRNKHAEIFILCRWLITESICMLEWRIRKMNIPYPHLS